MTLTSGLDPRRLDSFIASNRARFEGELATLVEIPSVSMDPQHRPDVEKCADVACQILRNAGLRAEKVPTSGMPVVTAEHIVNGTWPILTIYNHLDVQPADPAEWTHHPFRFARRDGWYGGRGTTDDKGPALAALMAVRYALETNVPVNFRFVWELEEEIGSPHFEDFLKGRGAMTQTDSILVSDTIWISRNRPAVAYALRGLQTIQLSLQTGAKDVHSGLVGGLARNPVGELCDVIAHCYDARTGRVKIPGFYNRVRRASSKEVDGFSRSGFTIAAFKAAHELRSLRKASGRDAVQRVWSMPTFEVHGVRGGYQGPGVKTIVPSQAEAKLSMRLVPDQKPAEIVAMVRRFVKKINPDVVVTAEHALEPYLGEHEGPFADAAREALRFGFGKDPAFVREGGSIGAVLSMKSHWKAPIVLMGLSLPEHGYHCPNENFDWAQASGGVKAFARYFDSLSRLT